MQIQRFSVGDTVVMKKKHPCSSDMFKVLRGGCDIRIICLGCRREVTLERVSFERMIKKVIAKEDGDKEEK